MLNRLAKIADLDVEQFAIDIKPVRLYQIKTSRIIKGGFKTLI